MNEANRKIRESDIVNTDRADSNELLNSAKLSNDKIAKELMRSSKRHLIGWLVQGVIIIVISVQLFLFVNESNAKNATIRATQTQNCIERNELRNTLSKILLDSLPSVRDYVKEGVLTKKQGKIAIKQTRAAVDKLTPINCKT